jgi:hypothetical protein
MHGLSLNESKDGRQVIEIFFQVLSKLSRCSNSYGKQKIIRMLYLAEETAILDDNSKKSFL